MEAIQREQHTAYMHDLRQSGEYKDRENRIRVLGRIKEGSVPHVHSLTKHNITRDDMNDLRRRNGFDILIVIAIIVTVLFFALASTDLREVTSLYEAKAHKSIFFHIHLAKTAGSNFNRAVARRYHGVCGNKAYSFSQPLEDGVNRDPTLYTVGKQRFSGKTKQSLGYHNCALISLESPQQFIAHLANSTFKQVHTTALIPCRDPVDHLFSQCNHAGKNFLTLVEETNCSSAISQCALAWDRYNNELLRPFNRVILFKYDEHDAMYDELDHSLQKRVLELKHGFRYINHARGMPVPPRDLVAETKVFKYCSEDSLRDQLLRMWSYYSLCERFLGRSVIRKYEADELIKNILLS